MNQEKIGEFIKEIRNKNHMTQKDFADSLGITYQAVSKWENGKNIPDIGTLKLISEKYHVDITEILDGEKKKKKKRKKFFIVIGGFFLIILISVAVILWPRKTETFQFKTISTSCKAFEISGSLAYNVEKTSIYISNINYCSGEDNQVYSSITCDLFEQDNNVVQKIAEGSKKENILLADYLKQVTFHIDNYNTSCKNYANNSLYLEINATNKEGVTTTYKVPLSLDDNCTKE